MPSPAAAVRLPLMREVDSPQAKTEGEKQEEKIFSPPVFCFAKASPLVRGGQEKLHTTGTAGGYDCDEITEYTLLWGYTKEKTKEK